MRKKALIFMHFYHRVCINVHNFFLSCNPIKSRLFVKKNEVILQVVDLTDFIPATPQLTRVGDFFI